MVHALPLSIKPFDCPPLRSDADLLRQQLAFGPATWLDLRAAGLSRERVLLAVGDLVGDGHHRVRLGPLLLELETDDEEGDH
jgi:hypothetical protein